MARIGIVCYPTYGGSGVVATELGKSLASRGHQVHFITYEQPFRIDHLNENIFFHEVNVRDYPLFEYPPYVLALASRMVDVVRHEKLDLLHVHYAIPHATAGYLAKQILLEKGIHIPVVTTLHGTDITLVGRDLTYKPVVRFSINHSDCVTAVSESLKQDTLKHFEVDKEIKVVPNFISIKQPKFKDCPETFRKAFCPEGERLLVHVSNFRPVKRVEDVVRVFSKVREKIPAKLMLVGDGPERPKVERLCRELGVCKDIRFLGKVNPLDELLCVSDLFILPSEQESFGLAALEAMAYGVPVVSSNAGGIPEVNIHGETGFVCPVGDLEGMAKASLHVLAEDQLPKFKQRAREQADRFSTEKVVPVYEEIYASVMNKPVQEV